MNPITVKKYTKSKIRIKVKDKEIEGSYTDFKIFLNVGYLIRNSVR